MYELGDKKLRDLYFTSSNPIVKKNAKHALSLTGKNPLTVVEGNQVMGDNFNLAGDFHGANVSIKSTLDNSAITINNSKSLDQPTKATLNDLLSKLEEVLSQAPNEMSEEAETVAITARILVDTATEEASNRSAIKIATEGFLRAGGAIADTVPTVTPLSKQIIALLTT